MTFFRWLLVGGTLYIVIRVLIAVQERRSAQKRRDAERTRRQAHQQRMLQKHQDPRTWKGERRVAPSGDVAKQQTKEYRQSYVEYLQSFDWKRKRAFVLRRDNWRCHYCHGHAKQVHHLRYLPNGSFKEPTEWLVAVCRLCHEKQHKAYPNLRAPP